LYKKEAEILLKSFIFDKKIQKNELKIDKKANFITNFIDLISDDSYQKFLSSNVSFINKKYIPSDLVDIKSNNIINLKNGLKIRKDANKSLNKMSKDYNLSTNKKIKIASSYRSYIYQK
jgi:LAS superfamily LD-carboxypeptidase LdcB